MKERLVTPEILQARSDAIIIGIQSAIDNGLDPHKLREVESHQWSRWHHRDLFGVYLGLKPLSQEFGPQEIHGVYKTYNTFLQYFPQEKDTGVRTLWDDGFVLNPTLVASIFEKHGEILTDNAFLNPHDEEGFTSTITILHESYMPEETEVLLGLLYGYPENSVSLFSKFGGFKVRDAMNLIWHEADFQGQKLSWNPPIGSMQLAENANGVRDDLARLIKLQGFTPEELRISRDVIDYALLVRNADIPYFPFATVLNPETGRHITHEEEAKMRRDYEASKMDEKLSRLLSSV